MNIEYLDLKISQLKEIIRRYGNRVEIKSSSTVVEKSQLEEICKICLIRHQHHLLDQSDNNSNINRNDNNNVEDEEDYVTMNTNVMLSTKYDLVANICHDSSLTNGISMLSSDNQLNTKTPTNTNVLQNGVYRIHVQNKVICLFVCLFLL